MKKTDNSSGSLMLNFLLMSCVRWINKNIINNKTVLKSPIQIRTKTKF